VLVTGAARGIGRATAIRLAQRGWDVFAGVRQAQDGEELAAAHAGRISPVVVDVTDAEQVAGLEHALPENWMPWSTTPESWSAAQWKLFRCPSCAGSSR
jgi:NAD(P)-dependent dehydrogenase (short-subunit alcohol dehydrogenase family)